MEVQHLSVIHVDTTEKLVTSACCDKQHAHAYLQRFHERLANNSKITTFMGYRSLMPSCAGFFEPRKLRLDRQNLRSLLKISYTAFPCLSQLISSQFTLEMCLEVRNHQKIHKKHILALKVIQGHSIR